MLWCSSRKEGLPLTWSRITACGIERCSFLATPGKASEQTRPNATEQTLAKRTDMTLVSVPSSGSWGADNLGTKCA